MCHTQAPHGTHAQVLKFLHEAGVDLVQPGSIYLLRGAWYTDDDFKQLVPTVRLQPRTSRTDIELVT